MRTFTNLKGIQGAKELEQRLKDLANEAQASKMGQSATRQAATLVKKAVIEAAPVGPKDNGEPDGKGRTHAKIKDNIKVKKGKSKGEHSATTIVHTGHAYQALFIERGTIHMAPRPFMGPAFARVKEQALSKMGTSLEKMLDKAARTGRSGATTEPDDA